MHTPTDTDPAEFTMFMRAHQDMVFSTAARLVGTDGPAEDIAQEVFIRAYERFEGLKTGGSAAGWLKTVARHLSLNHLTRHRRRWRSFSELTASTADHEAADGDIDALLQPYALPIDAVTPDLDAEIRRELVDRALRQLPEHQRVPLVLYHFEDLSYPEIAQLLRVSIAKLKSDIHRGRAALAPLLERLRP